MREPACLYASAAKSPQRGESAGHQGETMTNGEKPRRRRSVRSEAGTPSDRAVSAEQAMAQLAAIIEFTDDAIVGLTLDGTVASWNPGAERIFGYTAEESLGLHVSAFAPPDRREEASALQDRVAGGS